MFTGGYKGLRGVTGGYERLQGIRGGYKRSEEHTSELQSRLRISYAVFCLKKMTIYLIMPELLENMLFLLQHFFYLFVGKLGENQRNEEELVKNAVFWLPCSESLVVIKGLN